MTIFIETMISFRIIAVIGTFARSCEMVVEHTHHTFGSGVSLYYPHRPRAKPLKGVAVLVLHDISRSPF